MSNNPHHVVVHPRHWMHIWKVGYTPCADCRADSRLVATFLNKDGVIIDQKNYCKNHAPKTTRGAKKFVNSNDPISQLTFGLGFSIENPETDDENE